MPEPLRKLKLGLLRHPGGDKIMGQVLAAVPTAGLKAVLVAHHCHIVETGNESYRFLHSSTAAKSRFKDREHNGRVSKAATTPSEPASEAEPF